MIIHICIEDKIQFHLGIHRFCHKHGTGMCILEAKLDMQLASYLCQPLYQIYLDLTKAYDTLDCTHTLSFLKAYGLGPNIHSLIESVWEWELLVPKSIDCFGNSFHAHWGIQQGDVLSPVIFNIVVDAVIREWLACVDASFLTGLDAFFYANDGHLVGDNPDMLQEGLNIIVELFRRMGLEMNSNKTKAMIFFGSIGSHRMSSEAYAHCFDKLLPTQWECMLQNVRCPKCSKSITHQHLTLHLYEAHAIPMLQLPLVSESGPKQMCYIDFTTNGIWTPCPVLNCRGIPNNLSNNAMTFFDNAWFGCCYYSSRRRVPSLPLLPNVYSVCWSKALCNCNLLLINHSCLGMWADY